MDSNNFLNTNDGPSLPGVIEYSGNECSAESIKGLSELRDKELVKLHGMIDEYKTDAGSSDKGYSMDNESDVITGATAADKLIKKITRAYETALHGEEWLTGKHSQVPNGDIAQKLQDIASAENLYTSDPAKILEVITDSTQEIIEMIEGIYQNKIDLMINEFHARNN